MEIIVIVDGNSDYYRTLSRQLLDMIKSGFVKLYLNEKNMGLAKSRNRGVKLASGDVVAFIDDDAIADRRWVEELVRMYKKGAIAAGGKLAPLWVTKKPVWFPEEFYWMIGATHLGFPEDITEVRNTFGSNISFKKKIFIEIGGFKPEFGIKGKAMLQAEETELCERLKKKFGKGVMYNPNAVVYHKIFKRRVKLSFLTRRAFWQGYSKAVMENVVGDIGEEVNFLKYLIFNRTLDRLGRFVRGSCEDLLKLIFVWFFTFFVGVGYIYGKLAVQRQKFTAGNG
jgi:glycosyltransferase involved in cell wall biosynthesis